jgi:spermidine/putrescine transport system substrate-binding protein
MKKILTLSMMLLFVVSVVACSQKETLKVFIWGEYIDEELVEQFEAEFNVNVDIIIFESNEAAITQIKDASFDIVVPSDYAIEELASLDLLQTMDWSRIPNFKQTDMSADYLNLLTQIDDFKILDYAVPYYWGNIGIIYNTDFVSKEEVEAAGWDILARQDLRVMFYDISRDATMIALRAVYGQDISVNDATDLQLQAAEAWLENAVGPKTRFLTTEIYDVFYEPSTIDVAHAFSGEAIYLLPELSNLGYYVPTQGTNVWTDMMAIPKSANNTDLAYEFINFFSSYDIALQNSITIGYTSPRQDVVDEIVRQNIYGPEYRIEVRPYDQMHRFNSDLKEKIESLWSRIRAAN